MKKFFLLLTMVSCYMMSNGQSVGIGTTVPNTKLDVRGATADEAATIKVGNADESHNLQLNGGKQSDPNPFIQWKSGDSLRFATDDNTFTEWMRISSNGNVGINTKTPVSKLNVQGEYGYPAIPGSSSNGLFRLGISGFDALDIGINPDPPYGAWMQAGYQGTTADPLILEPSGGTVGIGISNPDPSAKLDVSSTTQGFLPPRMTQFERNSIISPAQGLIIYCTDCGSTGGEPQYFNGFSWNNLAGGPPASLSVGDLFGGGVVAYLFQPGDPGYVAGQAHGLIAAQSDQNTSIQWYNGTNITTGASGTPLGTGNANTNTIVTAQGAGSPGPYAAELCANLNLNGYSDWYLPSSDELNKLYINRTLIGNFSTGIYWSSSEQNISVAAAQNFSSGSSVGSAKATLNYVRAIRSF